MPPSEEAHFGQVVAKKAAAANDAFERGYREGLGLAEDWPWAALDWLARFNFDLEELEDDLSEWETDDSTRDDPRVLGPSELKDHYEEVVTGEGRLFRLGVSQALRDVWEAVLAPKQLIPASPGRSPNDGEK
jgi:hypothetical protein